MSTPSSALHPRSSLLAAPLAGTGPDLEHDAPDLPSREFPLSSFDPASRISNHGSRGSEPLDYYTVIAELDRLLEKVAALKRSAGIGVTA